MKIWKIKRVSTNDDRVKIRDFYLIVLGFNIKHLGFCQWVINPKAHGHHLMWNTLHSRWHYRIGVIRSCSKRGGNLLDHFEMHRFGMIYLHPKE